MKEVKEFYTELGFEKLAERKKPKYTKKELAYLKKILGKRKKILDVGCGFGRFTIPLAKAGYEMQGVDITPILIKKAKELSHKAKMNIKFIVGDMRKLSYKNSEFDAIICMWSVFVELINKKDQLKALSEMLRVLRENGMAVIEMPLPMKKSVGYPDIGDFFKLNKKTHIVSGKINWKPTRPAYNQDKKTLTQLMKSLKIAKYKIFIDKFGGRNRFFLQFWK